MKNLVIFAAMLAGAWAYGPEDVLGQKKGKVNKDVANLATPDEYVKLKSVKELTGTIQSVDAKSMTIRIEIEKWEANPNYKAPGLGGGKIGGAVNPQMQAQMQIQKDMAKLQQDQAALNLARTPQQRQQKLMQIQKDQQKLQMDIAKLQNPGLGKGGVKPGQQGQGGNNQPFRMVSSPKDYELDLQDNVLIRRLALATEFDDKGNVKVYTAAEMAALKKDGKPGYPAKFDDLGSGAKVTVKLTPPAAKAKTDDDAGVGNVARPTINTVMLVTEAPSTPTQAPPKKKAK